VSGSSLVFWDENATMHDFRAGHPMRPLRLELTMALAGALRLLDAPAVRVAAAGPAGEEQLTRVHTPAYIGAVRRAAAGVAASAFGLGTPDNPIFPGMHQAAAAAAVDSASVAAAQALWRGEAEHAVNLAGRPSGRSRHQRACVNLLRLGLRGVDPTGSWSNSRAPRRTV
jgi:acetoin utilization protein AcuC